MKKVFISADIEGTAFAATWDSTHIGGHNQGLSAKLACKKIREAAEAACKQELSGAKITLPDHFAVQITFKDHCKAVRSSYYPGAQLVNPTTIAVESDDWYEVCRMLMFVIL